MSKLGLNQELIAKARASAHKVAADVQAFIDEHQEILPGMLQMLQMM